MEVFMKKIITLTSIIICFLLLFSSCELWQGDAKSADYSKYLFFDETGVSSYFNNTSKEVSNEAEFDEALEELIRVSGGEIGYHLEIYVYCETDADADSIVNNLNHFYSKDMTWDTGKHIKVWIADLDVDELKELSSLPEVTSIRVFSSPDCPGYIEPDLPEADFSKLYYFDNTKEYIESIPSILPECEPIDNAEAFDQAVQRANTDRYIVFWIFYQSKDTIDSEIMMLRQMGGPSAKDPYETDYLEFLALKENIDSDKIIELTRYSNISSIVITHYVEWDFDE